MYVQGMVNLTHCEVNKVLYFIIIAFPEKLIKKGSKVVLHMEPLQGFIIEVYEKHNPEIFIHNKELLLDLQMYEIL